MKIKHMTTFDYDAIKNLYHDAGWSVYLEDEVGFQKMFESSFKVYGAYDDDLLVGIIRSISDQVHILYIQDIIVLTTHQKKGIGKALLQMIVKDNQSIRQKVLITDADSKSANAFYEACGFKKSHENNVNCYIRFDMSEG